MLSSFNLSIVFQGYSGDKTQFIERGEAYVWSLSNTPRLRDNLQVLKEDSQKRVIGEILTAFQENVIKKQDNLTKGTLHFL